MWQMERVDAEHEAALAAVRADFEAQRERAVAQIVSRWQQQGMSKCFVLWWERTFAAQRKRRILVKAVHRMMRIRIGIAFRGWMERSAQRLEMQTVAIRCLARLSKLVLSAAFRQWMDCLHRSVQSVRALHRMHRYRTAVALYAWQSLVRIERIGETAAALDAFVAPLKSAIARRVEQSGRKNILVVSSHVEDVPLLADAVHHDVPMVFLDYETDSLASVLAEIRRVSNDCPIDGIGFVDHAGPREMALVCNLRITPESQPQLADRADVCYFLRSLASLLTPATADDQGGEIDCLTCGWQELGEHDVLATLKQITGHPVTAPAGDKLVSAVNSQDDTVGSAASIWSSYFDLEKLNAWEMQQHEQTRQAAGLSAVERLRGRVAMRRAAQSVRQQTAGAVSAELRKKNERIARMVFQKRPEILLRATLHRWREFVRSRRHQRTVLGPIIRRQGELFVKTVWSAWVKFAKSSAGLRAEQARLEMIAAWQERTEALTTELSEKEQRRVSELQTQIVAQKSEIEAQRRDQLELGRLATKARDQVEAELSDAHRQIEFLADELSSTSPVGSARGARSPRSGSIVSEEGGSSTISGLEAAGSFPALLAQLNRSPPPWRMRATSKVVVTESVETLGAGLDHSVYEYAPGEMVEVLEIRKTLNGAHRGRTVHGWVALLSLLGTVRVIPEVGGGAVWQHVDGSAGDIDISPTNSGILIMESSDEESDDMEGPSMASGIGSDSDGSFEAAAYSQLDESGPPPMPSPSLLVPEGLPPMQARRSSSREAPPLPSEGPPGAGPWGMHGDVAAMGRSRSRSSSSMGQEQQGGLSPRGGVHARRE
jgi:hypothetical protein